MNYELRNKKNICHCEGEALGIPGFSTIKSGLPRSARNDISGKFGFSLLELIVVIAIVSIVSIATFANFPMMNSKLALELLAQDITSAEQLASSFGRSGPRLLNVHLKSNEVLSPKVAAMPQPDGSIISMPLEDMSPLLSLEELEKEMLVGVDERSRLVRS